jgi:hypothetical protein
MSSKTLSKNQYLYPSYKSYIASSQASRSGPMARGADKRLTKTVIYSLKRSTSTTTTGSPSVDRLLAPTEIDYTLAKVVQFNQSMQELSIGAELTSTKESEVQGGAVGQNVGQIGVGSTGFEFLFDRQAEVLLGTNGEPKYAEFGQVGVVSDIMDVYAVMTRNVDLFNRQGMYAPGENGAATMTKVVRQIYDLVGEGSESIFTEPVAVQLNPKFVFFGMVKSFQIRFVKFNHLLVPTVGFMEMKLDIFNANDRRTINNEMLPPSVPWSPAQPPGSASRSGKESTAPETGGRVRPGESYDDWNARQQRPSGGGNWI